MSRTNHRVGAADPPVERADKAETGVPLITDATAAGSRAEAQRRALIAGGKVISLLTHKDMEECVISRSVYDATIVMPQIARSAGYPTSLVHLSIRCFVFLFMNFFLQGFILYMVCQEELIMDKYAGQMHLCDFGANIEDCPGGLNCIGPSGTNYENAGRMYSWDVWATRVFVRDSLKTIFPTINAAEIDSKVDPGEYGVENSLVRYVCVFIFMMSVMSDLESTVDMVKMTLCVPTAEEPWMEYHEPQGEQDNDRVRDFMDKPEMDRVQFKFAGMPLVWKVITWCLVIIPKTMIWYLTCTCGSTFLMETSGIEDVIVNVTALTFILNLDEMMFELFTHKAVHHILDNMEPFALVDRSDAEQHTPAQSMLELERDRARPILSWHLLPFRFVLTIALTAACIGQYYWRFCVRSSRGGFVSKDLRLPADQVYPVMSFLFPWNEAPDKETMYWSFHDEA